jgi:hypothetical protein
MKSLKYLAIAIAVAGVAMTAVPAEAGSVGTKAGQTKRVNVQDNYSSKTNEETKYSTDTEKRTDNVVDKTIYKGDTYDKGTTVKDTSSTKVTVNFYEKSVNDLNDPGSFKSKHYYDSQTYDSLEDAKSKAKNHAIAIAKASRSSYSTSNLKFHSKDTWGWGWTNVIMNDYNILARIVTDPNLGNGSWSGSGITTNTVDDSWTKDRKVTTTSNSKEYRTDKWDDPLKKTLTQDTYKSVKYVFDDGADAIFVGDSDNMNNAYAAFGNVTEEHHYDRYEEFLLVHNVKDVTINVTTNTEKTYRDTYKHKTTTKSGTAVYNVNMNIAVTPIVLDLDGDGKIEASNGQYLPHSGEFSKNCVMFDFYGSGFPVVMEWVGTNDGLLCRPDADGTVKGTNLFGSANGYANGYDELASIDTNKDGVISGAELEGLMVWQDENHNGVADKGELKSLESLGITSIGATHNNFSGKYIRNGQSYKTFDWHPNTLKASKVNVAR